MDLEDFTPLIQLCAAFNFSYSAIDNFSNTIEMFVSTPFQGVGKNVLSKFSNKVRSVLDKEALNDPNLNTTELRSDLLNRLINLNNIVTKFLVPATYDVEYQVKFKGLYLLVGFFSFFLLFVTGITGLDHVTCLDKYCNSDKIYNCLFIIDCCISSLSLLILITTFSKKIPRVNFLFIVIFFLFMLVVFKITYSCSRPFNISPSNNFTIFFTLLLVVMPFFIHFLRVFFQFLFIQLYLSFLGLKYKRELKPIETKVNGLQAAKEALAPYLPH